MKKNLIFSITLTAVSCILFLTAVFAWFTDDAAQLSANRDVAVLIGDINLNVNCYSGIDRDKDGNLDTYITDADGNPVRNTDWTDALGTAHSKSDRKTILEYLYEPMTRSFTNDVNSEDRYNKTTDVISGTGVIIKLVVENPLDNLTSARVDMYFSNMDNYIFANLADSAYFTNEIIGENSARIMFKLTDMTIETYKDEDADIDTKNYLTEVSSVPLVSGTGDDTTEISRYFWDLSSNERVFSGDVYTTAGLDMDTVMTLEPGRIMEIDFKLNCMFTDEIDQNYSDHWESYITANSGDSGYTSAECEELRSRYQAELRYLLTDNEDINGKQLDFYIDRIYVVGKQLPRTSQRYSVYFIRREEKSGDTVTVEKAVVSVASQLFGTKLTLPSGTALDSLKRNGTAPSGYVYSDGTAFNSETDTIKGNMILYCVYN